MSSVENEKKPIERENLANVKKSIWGEINALSGLVIAGIAAIVILAIAAFIYMNRIPPKRVVVMDDADIFTEGQIEELEDLANDLKKSKDVNVVIATTRHNPHGTSDDDCKEYAADIYKEYCIITI